MTCSKMNFQNNIVQLKRTLILQTMERKFYHQKNLNDISMFPGII